MKFIKRNKNKCLKKENQSLLSLIKYLQLILDEKSHSSFSLGKIDMKMSIQILFQKELKRCLWISVYLTEHMVNQNEKCDGTIRLQAKLKTKESILLFNLH